MSPFKYSRSRKAKSHTLFPFSQFEMMRIGSHGIILGITIASALATRAFAEPELQRQSGPSPCDVLDDANCLQDSATIGGMPRLSNESINFVNPDGQARDADIRDTFRVASDFEKDGAEFVNHDPAVASGIIGDACGPASAGSDGAIKSRYLSIVPGFCLGGTPPSIKVTVASNPADPETVGDEWWAGPRNTILNIPHLFLQGSGLTCQPGTPHSESWPSGDIHLWGAAIRPNAIYAVKTCDAAGLACSGTLMVATGTWADAAAPYYADNPNEPTFADITAIVDKFKTAASAPDTVFTDIGSPGDQQVDFRTDFGDISLAVDAFKGVDYPFSTSTCP